MSILEKITKPIRSSLIMSVAVLGLAFIFAGCGNNYGGFSKSAQVDLAFRNGDSQSDYNYYYQGRGNMPYAIIGIDRSYTVPSRYWIPFEPDTEQLKKMSENMYGKHRYYATGFYILDPAGNTIGVWYSGVGNRSVRVDPENRTVDILFPNPENKNGGSAKLSSRNTH
jgi:hypothetical protein